MTDGNTNDIPSADEVSIPSSVNPNAPPVGDTTSNCPLCDRPAEATVKGDSCRHLDVSELGSFCLHARGVTPTLYLHRPGANDE